MPVQNSIVIPSATSISIATEPALNAFHSLVLLSKSEHVSGLGEWVARTVAALTPVELKTHKLVLLGLHYAAVPDRSWPSFPAYLQHLESSDPVTLRDKMLATYARIPPLSAGPEQAWYDVPVSFDQAAVLQNADSYLDFLRARFTLGDDPDEEAREREAYTYVIDPPAMKQCIVSHLRRMWDEYLAAEWGRVEPMLQDAANAFRQVDFSGMERVEAARLITGQSALEEKWTRQIEQAGRVIFVPSAHVGPYLWKYQAGEVLWMFFGARLPEGIQFYAPDLSRADIVMRLNALADDTRLQILKLVSTEGEQSSQDIIARLGLSQPTASRHLKQLCATGYLNERRCNGKCYTLNPDRIKLTLRAISQFLLGE